VVVHGDGYRSTGCICNVIVAEDRSRASRVQEQNRRRIRGIRCLDCPFSGILIHSKDIGAWVFEIRNSGHNHISSSTSTHPSLRKDELNTHLILPGNNRYDVKRLSIIELEINEF
jgi:hypothetical protein